MDHLVTALSSPVAAAASLRAAAGAQQLLQAANAGSRPNATDAVVGALPCGSASGAAPSGGAERRSTAGAQEWESENELTLALPSLPQPSVAADGGGSSNSKMATGRLLAALAFPSATAAERSRGWHDLEAAPLADGGADVDYDGSGSAAAAAVVGVRFSRSLLEAAEATCSGMQLLPATATCLAGVRGGLAAVAAASSEVAVATAIGDRVRGGARNSFRRGLFEGTVRNGVPRSGPREVCGAGPWARLKAAEVY
jgi:hypothetical protein